MTLLPPFRRLKLSNVPIEALVSPEDYDELSKYTWRLGKRGYVVRSAWVGGKVKGISMHRQVMGFPEGKDCEHADQNRLNNTRWNLRLSNRSQNMANVRYAKKQSAHSRYKGVSRLNRANLKNQWLAYIRKDYKTYYFGYYATQEEAAHVYNQVAEQLFGEFASLNDIPGDDMLHS